MASARLRELVLLVPVGLLITAGFAAVLLSRTDEINDLSLTYGGIFLGLCVVAHFFIRARLPDADPYLFPLAALLAAFGLVMIYRIDEELARQQAQWFFIGLVLFCATVIALRDHRSLERLRYTIAAVSMVLLFMPRLPGLGGLVNGAYLAINIGPVSFQPAEFAKIGIIIFLASYLAETRDVLVRGQGASPQPQALRAAAGDLGHGDAAARLHPRPRLVADVLRRLPRPAVRGDLAAVAGGRRRRHVRGGGVHHRPVGQPRAGPRLDLARPLPAQDRRGRGLPDRPEPVRAGRRRAVRHAASAARCWTCPAGARSFPRPTPT